MCRMGREWERDSNVVVFINYRSFFYGFALSYVKDRLGRRWSNRSIGAIKPYRCVVLIHNQGKIIMTK